MTETTTTANGDIQEPATIPTGVEGQEVRSQDAPAGPAEGDAESSLEQARAEVAKLKELWMRTAADFDNFRKRSRREVEDATRVGREDLLRQLLPVFDNLERGIVSSQRAADVKAVADGLSLVHKQFLDTLTKAGIQRVPAVGKPFDPSVHEAIQQVETGDHAPGTVIAEVQAGYMQGERLVRAAMVVVAKAANPPASTSKPAVSDPSGDPTAN